MTATSTVPKVTNVAGVDGTSGTGKSASANGVCTFTARIAAKKETVSASSAGFGLTLPVFRPRPVSGTAATRTTA